MAGEVVDEAVQGDEGEEVGKREGGAEGVGWDEVEGVEAVEREQMRAECPRLQHEQMQVLPQGAISRLQAPLPRRALMTHRL